LWEIIIAAGWKMGLFVLRVVFLLILKQNGSVEKIEIKFSSYFISWSTNLKKY